MPDTRGTFPSAALPTPLGLLGAVPLSDAVVTAPVVAAGRAVVGRRLGHSLRLRRHNAEALVETLPRGGPANCNNVSSPRWPAATCTSARWPACTTCSTPLPGRLSARSTAASRSSARPWSPASRVYFATLGTRVYALGPDGTICWIWDFRRGIPEVCRRPLERSGLGDSSRRAA